jgi:hypothetical protein
METHKKVRRCFCEKPQGASMSGTRNLETTDRKTLNSAIDKGYDVVPFDTPRDKSTGILGSTKPLNEEVLASSRPEMGFSTPGASPKGRRCANKSGIARPTHWLPSVNFPRQER